MTLQKQADKYDIQDVERINDYISEYEQQNGIKITKIAQIFRKPDNAKVYNKKVKEINRLNASNLKINKNAIYITNFYRKDKLQTINLTEEQVHKVLDKIKDKEYICVDDIFIIEIFAG